MQVLHSVLNLVMLCVSTLVTVHSVHNEYCLITHKELL